MDAPTPIASARPAPAPLPDGLTILQSLIAPEAELCTERDLFVRLHGTAGQSHSTGEITFSTGAHIQFDTYFNLFNIGKWHHYCDLRDIGLQLRGTGRVEVSVFLTHPDRSWGRLVNEVITLHPDHPHRFDIPLTGQAPESGLLFFELRSLSEGRLDHAAWDTTQQPLRQPDLALVITTFNRDAAMTRTLERFTAFRAQSPLAKRLELLVINNGSHTAWPQSPGVAVFDNANLGGAGGFARGILEARARGASHCLFMDDDAAAPMEAIARTWAYLAYARAPDSAVAGAMISVRHAWAIWENGATFQQFCHSRFGGTDLRDPEQVMAMEYASTGPMPPNFYGGWWFYAFALDAVRHLPFPFFVRGDDVSFSLAHRFPTTTLPGVVSFQEGFTEKDTPLTWYLDLRSHLAHHLSLPHMDIGRWRTTAIAMWFWLRTLITHHYETMEALAMAMEDVLQGPEMFANAPGLESRRATLAALCRQEAWQDMAHAPPAPPERQHLDYHKRRVRFLGMATGNGLLIPGFRRLGNRLTLPASERWKIFRHWGAAEIRYEDRAHHKTYTVRHDKARAIALSLRIARALLRLLTGHKALKARWQAAYPDLTSTAYWQDALGLEARASRTAHTPAARSLK